jgi:hypothetical protein
LIEASTDAYWGEGRTGKGKNKIGKLLEQIRVELKYYVPVTPAGAPLAAPAGVPADDFFEGEEVSDAPAAPLAQAAPAAPLAQPAAPLAEQKDVLGIDDTAENMQKGGNPEDDRTIILTSDQKVLLISLRKEKVLNSLLNIMKSVAVDCEMNLPDNYDGTYKCVALDGNVGDFTFHPDLQKDIVATTSKYKDEEVPAPAPPPAAPPAAPAAEPAAEPAAPAPVTDVDKVRRITYRKADYLYRVKLDEAKQPLGYIFYSPEDKEGTNPIGFVKPHPVSKLPKGDILPVPEGY